MSENPRTEGVGAENPSILSEFLDEFSKVWSALPHKALMAILLLAWVAMFHFLGSSSFGYLNTASMFQWLQMDYRSNPDDEHGQIVPLIVLVILWIRRDELLKVAKDPWWPALALLVLALGLHILGYAVQQIRISIMAFVLGIYAITGIVWGRKWMYASFFPMFLLAFCVPLAAMSEVITFPLRLFVTKISVGLAHNGLGIDVFSAGSQIMDGRGRPLYDVAPACSGMRSLIAMALITIIYTFLNFKSWWKRGVIIFSALPLAVLGNIARVTTVIIVGEIFGKDAGAMIEQKFGFLTFAVAIGGMLLVGWLLRENRPSDPDEPTLPPNPAKAVPI